MVTRWLTSATISSFGLQTAGPAARRMARQRGASCPTRRRSPRWTSARRRSPQGARRELVWLLEHPPLYTAGTSAQAGRPRRGALSGPPDRPRRAVHLSRARPAGGLCDARPQAPRAGRARLRRDAGGMADPHARRLQRARRAARGPRRRLGARGRTRAPGTKTRSPPSASAPQALGDAARHRAQRRSGPVAFLRHRALRRVGHALRRHQPGRSRPCR